jgi:hypothetical protein
MYIYISMYVCPYLIVQARRTGILKPSDISALPKSAQDDWELNQSVRGTNTVDRASRLSILIEGVLAEGVAKRKRKKEKEREQGRKREREREREKERKRERERAKTSQLWRFRESCYEYLRTLATIERPHLFGFLEMIACSQNLPDNWYLPISSLFKKVKPSFKGHEPTSATFFLPATADSHQIQQIHYSIHASPVPQAVLQGQA